MGSSVMIYIPSFIKIGSSIKTLGGGGYTDTQMTWRSLKPNLISFKIRKVG
jgi:hypothetical protein